MLLVWEVMRSKRLLCGLTAAAVMLGSVGTIASAEELQSAVVEKTYAAAGERFTEDGITYEEWYNGSLRVVGLDSGIYEVFIPETVRGKTVTAIGDRAFYGKGDPAEFCVKPNKALPIRQDLGQVKNLKGSVFLWKRHRKNY